VEIINVGSILLPHTYRLLLWPVVLIILDKSLASVTVFFWGGGEQLPLAQCFIMMYHNVGDLKFIH